jgi:hypothetical protein
MACSAWAFHALSIPTNFNMTSTFGRETVATYQARLFFSDDLAFSAVPFNPSGTVEALVE